MENEEELRRFLRRIEKVFYSPPPYPAGQGTHAHIHIGHYLGGQPSPPPPSQPFAAAINVTIVQPPIYNGGVFSIQYAPALGVQPHGLIMNPQVVMYQPPPNEGRVYRVTDAPPNPGAIMTAIKQNQVVIPIIAPEWFE